VAEFASRILEFHVRAAAVDDLLRDLKSHRLGDISILQSVLNDAVLWEEVFHFWTGRGWVVPAPQSALHVFPGPEFRQDLTLREFCGWEEEEEVQPPAESE
jgi:hypothetical protein